MEGVVDVGGKQVVAAMLVLVALQVLVDLVHQQCHGLKGSTAQVHCVEQHEDTHTESSLKKK